MLDQPQNYIEPFAQAGSDLISIHVDPEYGVPDTLQKIKSLGKKAGIVLTRIPRSRKFFSLLE